MEEEVEFEEELTREDLKPCPFCGGNPFEWVEGGCLNIRCFKCCAKVSRALVPPGEWEKAVQHCRKAWNRRVGC